MYCASCGTRLDNNDPTGNLCIDCDNVAREEAGTRYTFKYADFYEAQVEAYRAIEELDKVKHGLNFVLGLTPAVTTLTAQIDELRDRLQDMNGYVYERRRSGLL